MATTLADLELKIRARDEAAAVLRQLKGELKGLGVETAKTSKQGLDLGNIMKGAFAFFGVQMGVAGLRQLAEFEMGTIRAGAAAERMGNSFQTNFGSRAQSMLAAMREASRGTIADMDLMLNANRALTLGVAADSQTMSQLLEIAMVKGRQFGLTTTQAFDNMVTGIGRMSPLILDNLGIMTGGEKTFEAYAASIGRSADALTDMEKRQALVNKVIAEGMPEVERNKKALDDQASAWERLSAAFRNWQAAQGKQQGSLPAKAAGGLAGFFQGQADAINQTEEINRQVQVITRSIDALNQSGELAGAKFRQMQGDLAGVQFYAYHNDLEKSKMLLDALIATYPEFSAAIAGATTQMDAATAAQAALNAEMDKAALKEFKFKWAPWLEQLQMIDLQLAAMSDEDRAGKAGLDLLDKRKTLLKESTDAQDEYNLSLMTESDLYAELTKRAQALPERDPERFRLLTQANSIQERLNRQGQTEGERAAREREQQAKEAAERLKREVEDILKPTEVTSIDFWKTSMGKYQDKWDEYIRRIRSGIQDAQSAWKGMIPKDILEGGKEARAGWLAEQEELFYAGMLPEKIDWAAFDRQLAEARQREAAREALIQEAMKRAGGVGRAEVVEALGLPVQASEAAQTIAGAFQQTLQTSEIGKPLAELLEKQLDAQQPRFKTAGQRMMTWFLEGAEAGITPTTGRNFARKIWPYFAELMPEDRP